MQFTKVARKLRHLRFAVGLAAGWLALVAARGFGQGMLTMTFEGQEAGTGVYLQQYFEAGMWFRPIGDIGPGNGFIRQGDGGSSFLPSNGTDYLQASARDSLIFSFLNGSLFNLGSVDLAEFSTLYNYPATIQFIGYRPDGRTVTANLTTDGVIDGTGPLADFQTFTFGPEFSNLQRVEIPSYGWCLDNLVVTVPEPGPRALLVAAGLAFVLYRRGKAGRNLGNSIWRISRLRKER